MLWKLHDHPSVLGITAYGAPAGTPVGRPPRPTGPPRAPRRRHASADAARTKVFWLLAGSFAVCGASTNGLVGTHFIPAAHDHGMPTTTAAGLLALVGVFDVVGTIFSGWLTDRVDPRILLAAYYTLRGGSLFLLPSLFSDSMHVNMLAFVLFYGLDWVATVPPTIALCRSAYGERAPIVFGWVFASHQLGAAAAALGAGLVRDHLGAYDLAWYVAGRPVPRRGRDVRRDHDRSSVRCVTSAHGLWRGGRHRRHSEAMSDGAATAYQSIYDAQPARPGGFWRRRPRASTG